MPEWLGEYINTEKMQAQKYISMVCGTLYSDLFGVKSFYSSLDHSVGVALIVWNFTHDRAQTLAGLFHDIFTPAFKHCVDFLNGDYMTQESTEGRTTAFIKNSEDIMSLLKRDGISVAEVDDYHLYPITDNDTPQLSADRLEYSLSNALFTYEMLSETEIADIYNDLEIQTNESGEAELGFRTKALAEKFVDVTSRLSVVYRDDRTRFSMQFIAEVLKGLEKTNEITLEDLYTKKESEIIEIIENSKYREAWDKWRHAKKINTSVNEPRGVYFVHQGTKIRYVNPLCGGVRISDISENARAAIAQNLAYNTDNYVFLDFQLN